MLPSEIVPIWMFLELSGLKAPDILKSKESREAAIDAWTACLPDVDATDLKRAAIAYIRAGERFWPTPGQLLQHLPEKAATKVDDSDRAWGWLLRCVSSRGGYAGAPTSYSHLQDKDRAIRAGVQACGGWQALCQAGPGDNTAHRASFRAAYRATMEMCRLQDEDETGRAALGLDVGHGLRLLEGGE